jgi:hypothetical protein
MCRDHTPTPPPGLTEATVVVYDHRSQGNVPLWEGRLDQALHHLIPGGWYRAALEDGQAEQHTGQLYVGHKPQWWCAPDCGCPGSSPTHA